MMLSPLWGSLGNNLIAVCKQMQDDLGHLHDRQALAMALFCICRRSGSDTGSDTSSDTGAAAAVASRWPQIKAGQEAALRDFLERWQTMDMFWFQRQLLPLVEWSARQASSTSSALTETTVIRSSPSCRNGSLVEWTASTILIRLIGLIKIGYPADDAPPDGERPPGGERKDKADAVVAQRLCRS